MKIGINRWTLPPHLSLAECFAMVKQAGFDSIEINIAEDGEIRTDSTESEVRAILDSFVAAKTMIKIDDHYLSLAVFRERTLLKELTQSSDSPQVHQAPASESLLRVV